MKKIFIILIFILTSCGYQPIYLNKNLENFKFSQISSRGEESINRQLINFTNLEEVENNPNFKKLIITSLYRIEETSKNSKGQVDTYRSIITIDLTIKENKVDKIIETKKFVETFSYNNKDTKLELDNYQKEIKQILVNKISEDIVLFLNLK